MALSEYDEPLLLETPPHSCLSKEQIMKVRKLIQKSSGINPEVTFNNMASKLGSFHCSVDFKIELFLPQWWLGVREEWNKIFTDFLVKKIKEGLKLKPSVGFFNLTDAIIPAVTLEILNKGPKFVPYTLPDTPQVKDFEENLYKQVFWLLNMLEKDSGSIPQFSHVSSLLQYLVSHTNGSSRDLFNSIYKDLQLFYLKPVPPSPSKSFAGFFTSPPEGCCWINADKGHGIILLPVQYVYEQEIKLLEKLGATPVSSSSHKILRGICKQETELRSRLCGKSLKFLSKFKAVPNPEIPFLKTQGKIHKMSREDLHNKNISSLSFRPVCDSKSYSTKPLASALMYLLRELNKLCISKMNAADILPKSGWDISEKLSTLDSFSSSPFSISYVCDLSDAYSNCNADDLKESVHILYSLVRDEFESWKVNLIITLADFVLSNNFIHAAGAYWKLGKHLPMGCTMSGEALDTICLSRELTHIKFLSKSLFTSTYRRFRDDTMVMDEASSIEVILNNITVVGSLFPSRIPLKYKFSILINSYLDCFYFKNVFTKS